MPHRLERDNYTQTVLANEASVPGELLLYGFTVYNDSGAAQFVQLFDDGYQVPPDGNVPAATFVIGANAGVAVYYGEAGRLCKGGVSLANSSTAATKTAGSADCLFDIQYAHIIQEG
jgi:hypothetical protein